MKNRKFLIGIVVLVAIFLGGMYLLLSQKKTQLVVETIPVKSAQTQILAQGVVRSENEATISFPTAGKLAYLPLKEGDHVNVGQTIAQQDTYPLQKQLEVALNNYANNRNSFDQTQQNSQTGVLQGQQKYSLEVTNKGGFSSGDSENNIINDMVGRIVNENQAALNTSVANVDLASYALQLATLTSPINGVLVREDVKNAGVTVTPATSFYVADPSSLVFRANVDASDVDFIQEGSPVTISVNNKTFQGSVERIYPQTQTLPSGQVVYQVDIASTNFPSDIKLLQTGSVLIQNKFDREVMLVPSWMVVGGNSIWIEENGTVSLKKITVGDTTGDKTEVLGGLSSDDKLIQNPKALVSKKYIVF